MNDVNGLGTKPQAHQNPSFNSPASPGALLRNAREAAGVSIEALASAMKVSVKKIEGMEADNYTALPDVVFARALAASICRVFGIDTAPVLALMPKAGAHSLSSAGANINASFKGSSERPRRNSFVTNATRPLGVAVVVLLLGAAVFVFLPYRNDAPESSDSGAGMVTYEPGAIQDMPLEMALPAEEATAEAQKAAVAEQALIDKEQVKSSAVVSSDGVVEFTARGPSWIQVRDASKKVVFERTLAKGEVASASGAPPLKVVVGRAEQVDVKVRGAEFDLAGVAQSGVARFEVE